MGNLSLNCHFTVQSTFKVQLVKQVNLLNLPGNTVSGPLMLTFHGSTRKDWKVKLVNINSSSLNYCSLKNTYSWVDIPGWTLLSVVLWAHTSHTGRIQHQRATVSQSEVWGCFAAAVYFHAGSFSVHLCTRPPGPPGVMGLCGHLM